MNAVALVERDSTSSADSFAAQVHTRFVTTGIRERAASQKAAAGTSVLP